VWLKARMDSDDRPRNPPPATLSASCKCRINKAVFDFRPQAGAACGPSTVWWKIDAAVKTKLAVQVPVPRAHSIAGRKWPEHKDPTWAAYPEQPQQPDSPPERDSVTWIPRDRFTHGQSTTTSSFGVPDTLRRNPKAVDHRRRRPVAY